MFRELLVPIDGSARSATAIRIAAGLADRLESSRERRPPIRLIGLVSRGDERARSDIRELADRWAVDLRRRGIEIEIEIEMARMSIADELAGRATAAPHGLMVMTTHGHGRSEVVLGSVASATRRRTERPLLFVGPAALPEVFDPTGPITVALDDHPRSVDAIEPAIAWAVTFGNPVEIVTVQTPGEAGGHRSKLEQLHFEHLAREISRSTRQPTTVEVVHAADAAGAILEQASVRTAGLIVLAAHARRSLRRLRHGSVTAQVVRHATTPVLTAHAPGD